LKDSDIRHPHPTDRDLCLQGGADAHVSALRDCAFFQRLPKPIGFLTDWFNHPAHARQSYPVGAARLPLYDLPTTAALVSTPVTFGRDAVGLLDLSNVVNNGLKLWITDLRLRGHVDKAPVVLPNP
jgi:hypothetical protein